MDVDVWAIPEGTPVFANEPLVTIRGTLIQAQILETILLLCINYPTLTTTKAYRIVRASKGRAVLEFGSRRAHGFDAATEGARGAYIAGCAGSACTIAGQKYAVPVSGTIAHSYVQLHDSELKPSAAMPGFPRTTASCWSIPMTRCIPAFPMRLKWPRRN